MASKVFLGWPNQLAGQGVTLSGGSWLSDLPLNNILDRTPTVIARSSDLLSASTQFDMTLPSTKVLKSFALVNHNLSLSAVWRIRLGSTLGASDVYDSGVLPVWSMNFDSDLLEWESDSWWEGDYDDDYIGHPFAAIHLATSSPAAQYMRIEIIDPSNTHGYIQIGRAFAGSGITPNVGMAFGMSDSWENESIAETSIGGSEYFDERRSFRVAKFTIDAIDQDTEFKYFYELHRRLGTTGEILFLPDYTDIAACQMTGFVGRLRQLASFEYPFYKLRSLGFEIKELL